MNVLITCPRTKASKKDFIQFFESNGLDYKFIFPEGQGFNSEELCNIYGNEDVLIVGDDLVDSYFIKNATSLKHIIKWGKGIDNINQEICKEKNINVLNSPGNLSKYVSEHALSLTLSLLKKVKQNTISINKNFWYKDGSDTLFGKTVGFFGFGSIGNEISKLLMPFNVKIIFYDIRNIESTYSQVSIDHLFRESDILYIASELNEKTRYSIGLTFFEIMKNSAYLINVSRGKIIIESDLIFALENSYLKGVGLDVLDHEPIEPDNKLKNFQNVVITCHNASNTTEASKEVNYIIIKKLKELL